MQKRRLGSQGLEVSALGFGCMSTASMYGRRDDSESLATLNHAIDVGATFLDTADVYGPHTSERLVGQVLRTRRQEVVLATKFGLQRDATTGAMKVCGRPDYARAACEASLQRLGVETIDLYYLHRVDREVPIEDTVGAMAALVREGKVRYLGLSEASPATLKRAHAVHPISALQSEYSLWTRDPEDAVLPAARALGIGFVAYSPLGRGFLTGQIKRYEDLDAGDVRRHAPRYQGENFALNVALADRIRALAADKGCTPAQLALAWLLAQGPDIVPIPGTGRAVAVTENVGAVNVVLSSADLAAIDAVSPKGAAAGPRYPPGMMQYVNG